MNESNGLSNSQVIRAKMRLTCSPLGQAFATLWTREDLPSVFPAFMTLLHHIARATVPLMRAASSRSEELEAQDPLCHFLRLYYAKHAEEERDHDLWLLDDLETIHYPRERVLDIVPLPDMASLMGAQYYWIHHFHPVMLLGCIAVLEGSPPTAELIDRLEQVTGLRSEAFRTYRFHGAVDPHHVADLDQALDTMPLSPRHIGLIGISATHTANTLARCVARLTLTDRPEQAA